MEMKHILKCENSHYTMKDICPKCSKKALSSRPPKYSVEDKYAEYRRRAKEQMVSS
jgi:H/ACA ribonucleoprotein complex subunit 3